jgi:eukaryotic-like serine/threonine-protein kinase
MPSLQLGSHANFVYIFQGFTSYQYQGIIRQDVTSFLKRYDVTTGAKVVIASLPHSRIDSSSASISPDGQWIVFETYTDVRPFSGGAFVPMLELVRIDGHYLQTLFCGATMLPGSFPDNFFPATRWSADQTQLLFNQVASGITVNLLNLGSGSLQEMVTHSNLSPSRWLDTTRAFVASHPGPGGGPGLLVLDTRKGSDQQETSLQTILTPQTCQSYALSPDTTQLYVYHCTETNNGVTTGPSTVSVQSLPGGTPHTIFTSQQLALCSIEPISGVSLLLGVCNESGSQIGWWKINTDGTGLTRLQNGNLGLPTLAPDGNTYILWTSNATQDVASLLIGKLNGGAPTAFATAAYSAGEIGVVGWILM